MYALASILVLAANAGVLFLDYDISLHALWVPVLGGGAVLMMRRQSAPA